MEYKYKGKSYAIRRYPATDNKSLRPWSAADELLLQQDALAKFDGDLLLVNDRFGFLATVLSSLNPVSVLLHKSQEKSVVANLENNNCKVIYDSFVQPLELEKKNADLVLMKVPKSMDLFRMQLSQCANALKENGEVLCAFMTRHFTKQMIEIAEEYFQEVEQSKAVKKARLMSLKGAKKKKTYLDITEIKLNDDVTMKQYAGVFSSKHIDNATAFLIEHIELLEGEEKVLDMAAGNGVFGKVIKCMDPSMEVHLMDDSALAMDSARLNFDEDGIFFHYKDGLEDFDEASFDLVVSNPPFHFEHETNIDVSLKLFKEAYKVIAFEGRMLIVANLHLNYETHLKRLFKHVETLADNGKFVIYQCVK